jgi:hypothetical protein
VYFSFSRMAATWVFFQKAGCCPSEILAFDRDLWACIAGIPHFRFLLEGHCFSVWMDHKPLTYALALTLEPWTARQARHLSYIVEFTGDIRQMSGIDNVVAHTLSRLASTAPGVADKGSTEVKAPSGSFVSPADAGRCQWHLYLLQGLCWTTARLPPIKSPVQTPSRPCRLLPWWCSLSCLEIYLCCVMFPEEQPGR